MFFSRWPVAQPRNKRPSTDAGKPIKSERGDGRENQANAIASTNPNGTRNFATRSAYGLGNALIRADRPSFGAAAPVPSLPEPALAKSPACPDQARTFACSE